MSLTQKILSIHFSFGTLGFKLKFAYSVSMQNEVHINIAVQGFEAFFCTSLE